MSAVEVAMTDWHQYRACTDVPVEVFFPEPGQTAAQAKAICASCPVAEACLAYALENREEYGVWGGRTPRERYARRRAPARPRVARCGTSAGYYRHVRQTFTEPCRECREAHAMVERLRRARFSVVR